MADHIIKERIQLTGDDEVESQFAKLGAAGAKAFNDIKKAQEVLAKTQGLSGLVNQINKDIASIQKQAKALGKTYNEVGAQARKFATNVALISGVVVGAGAAVFGFTKRAADIADQTDKAAQAAGLAIDQYGKLQFVFEQGNVDAGAFGTAMKFLNKNINAAVNGVGPGAATFKALGVSVKDANGQLKPTDQILQELANAFQKLPDGPRKSALALQLFGKAGASIIPIMNDGGKEMLRLENRAVALGLVLDKTAGKIGDDFGDALNEVTRSIGGISTQVGLQFAPAFTEAFKEITDVIIKNRAEILAFTQVIANQLGPALKDIINAFTGNDTAVVNKQFLALRDTVVSIGQALGIVSSIVTALFNGLTELVDPFVQIFNGLFGTKFTSQAAVISVIIFGLTGGFKLLGLGIKAVAGTWGLLVKIFGSSAGAVAILFTGLLGVIAEIQITLSNLSFAVQSWAQVFGGAISSVTGFITTGLAGWTSLFATAITGWLAIFQKFGVDVIGVFTTLTAPIVKVFTDIGAQVKTIIDGIVSAIQNAIKAATTLGGLLGGGGGDTSGDGGGGFARGGRVRGPGTSTSDSIPAWLSNEEFVMRAKAVRKYGAGFMAAVNGLRFKMPTFALGGPVSTGALAMPGMGALAPSGSSGRPFSLTIGAETFEGLIAPDAVAHKLVRFAQTKAVRSAGRKPSWSK